MIKNPDGDLTGWFSSFFDGDGTIMLVVEEEERVSVGYTIRPKMMITHSRVAGYVDSEGAIKLGVAKADRYRLGYSTLPKVSIGQAESADMLADFLESYADAIGVNSSTVYVDDSRENTQDTFNWSVQGVENCEKLLGEISDLLIVKRPQAEIMKNDILPLIRSGRHLSKSGFIRLMEMKQKMDSYKGGARRSKYTPQYFSELWGIGPDDQTELGGWDVE